MCNLYLCSIKVLSLLLSLSQNGMRLNCLSASVVQWLGFLPIDQTVIGSNPGRSKGVFF